MSFKRVKRSKCFIVNYIVGGGELLHLLVVKAGSFCIFVRQVRCHGVVEEFG